MKTVIPTANTTISFMLITDLILKLRVSFSQEISLVMQPILVEAAI